MIIYAYTLTFYPSLIKVGQTRRDVEKRIKEQVGILPIVNEIKPYTILYIIDDKALKKYHVSGEWFNCTIKQLDNTIKRIAQNKIKQGCNYLNDNELKLLNNYTPDKKYKTQTLTYNGPTLIFSEWSKHTGISLSLIHNRYKRGWSVERILNTPARKRVLYNK